MAEASGRGSGLLHHGMLASATFAMRLAIVIPTLDEVCTLDAALAQATAEADLVVVADGGSVDGTRAVAERHGVPIVVGPPGRGVQLNAGAAAAGRNGAEALLFLHADTRLPAGAGAEVRRALARDGTVGGGFALRFDDRRRLLPLGGRVVTLRTRLTGCPLGDQAQFVRRDVFDALGGFRDWPILEDLDFARRLKRHGRMLLIDRPVTTAARRYLRQGVVRTIATNWTIWALYFAGVPPRRLARLYRHIR